MSVTRQEPARDDSSGRSEAGGQEAGHAMPFDAFLEWLSVGAKARNDTAWLEWYEGWLRNLPEGDGREDYLKRSRADYEARMGETVDEHMDRTRKERLDERIRVGLAESLAERTRFDIEDATNKQIMVDNFKIFQREYTDMSVLRSC